MKLLVGTGVYVDFPTINGNIYTRNAIEKAFNDPELRKRLSEGTMIGGILDPTTCRPIDGVQTHKVLDIKVYRDEVVVEVETFDNPQSISYVESLKHPIAAIVMVKPQRLGSGQIITEIEEINTVHLRENPIYIRKEENA